MRNTWAAYLVEHRNRQDRVDARRQALELSSSARAPPSSGSTTCGCRADSTVTMFDDHCCQLTGGGTSVAATGPSRGLVLALDQSTRTATLVAQYSGGEQVRIRIHGRHAATVERQRVRRLGIGTYFSEYSRSGRAAAGRGTAGAQPHLPRDARAVGRRAALPARRGAARRTGGTTTVYASWNGATQVVSWRVLAATRRRSDERREQPPPSPGSRRRSRCRGAIGASRSRRSMRTAG